MILSVVLASLGFAAAAGASAADSAKVHRSTRASEAVKDCFRDGDLDAPYTADALRRAAASLGADREEYTTCDEAMKSQLALFVGKTGRDSAVAAYKDCSRHGSLRHRYSKAILRKALRTIPADYEEYTACVPDLNSQLAGHR